MSIDFQAPVSADDIEKVFNIILKRPVNNDEWKSKIVDTGISFERFLNGVAFSPEFRKKTIRAVGAVASYRETVDDYKYRLPEFLERSNVKPKKVSLIGSCLLDSWGTPIKAACPGLKINRIVFNNSSQLPEMTKEEAATYDFNILQVPLRSILPESSYLNLKFSDKEGHERLFQDTCQIMRYNLDALLKYNEQFGVLSFVLNFCLPQQNPMGRMVDRYSLTNMVYFVEELNKQLYEYVSQQRNCHIIDIDQISSTYGRKYFQDDSVSHYNHGSVLRGIAGKFDDDRIEPKGDVQKIYLPDGNKFILAVWYDALSQYKMIQQTESIKLVIFDLDDTLWSGVAAERGWASVEGWPLGVLEALSYLWKRGILVAIVSKNEDAPTRTIWRKAHRFNLENFAAVKINWRSKAENIAEILKEVNLLPGSVLFVDDNPTERAAVKAAFPDIHVMDQPLAHWRRVLLWSTELQQASVTDESVARTEMIHAQVQREQKRSTMSHEEFLASLNTNIKVSKVSDTSNKSFDRCFELLNKTNQFNTTGKRWTQVEIGDMFAAGGYFLSLEISDKFAAYGITGLLIINERAIEQFVLSCRVFGMQIERAAIAIAQRVIGGDPFGKVVITDKNHLCVDLYRNLNFTEVSEGLWLCRDCALALPPHIGIDMDLEPETEGVS
jgi:FkbH-like protein